MHGENCLHEAAAAAIQHLFHMPFEFAMIPCCMVQECEGKWLKFQQLYMFLD